MTEHVVYKGHSLDCYRIRCGCVHAVWNDLIWNHPFLVSPFPPFFLSLSLSTLLLLLLLCPKSFTNMLKNKQPTVSSIRATMQQQHMASAHNRRLAQQMENRPSVQAALHHKQVRGHGADHQKWHLEVVEMSVSSYTQGVCGVVMSYISKTQFKPSNWLGYCLVGLESF